MTKNIDQPSSLNIAADQPSAKGRKSMLRRIITIGAIMGAVTACGQDNSDSKSESGDAAQQMATSDYSYPFQNPALSLDARVDDLVGRMTLEEKLAQMYDKTPAIERLGIPAYYWWNEALHGVARAGKATVFPQAIGLAATWDEDLMLDVATAISDEGRAKYHDFIGDDVRAMYAGITFWSPNINIFRDPRWGRGQETYGEDPYLTGRMAINFVRGLQGDNPDYLKSVATIKHFAVHSGPEATRHVDDYNPTEQDFQETYLPAFRDTIAETNVESLMCAYNRFRGEPACGSGELLQTYLRGEYGFDGYVVSDCGAIGDFYYDYAHDVVDTPAEAAALAVKMGTDVNCGDWNFSKFAYLGEALEKGLITQEEIDTAVKRLFRARFKLGMFDPDEMVPYSKIGMEVVGSEKHISLTETAARRSLVLLKNDGTLPLKDGVKVAVLGPNANSKNILIGNYHGTPIKPVTPLSAIRDRVGKDNVFYSPASAIAETIMRHHKPVPASVFYHKGENGDLVSGLKAAYYNEPALEGDVALARTDAAIDFYWKHSPLNERRDDEFSVAWTGVIKPDATGMYSFKTSKLALKIDGEAVSETPIRLEAGKSYSVEATASIQNVWHSNVIEQHVQLSWLKADRDLKAEALAAAEKADVVLFFGGLDAYLEGEEMDLTIDGFIKGDRTNLKLPAVQEEVLKALQATGKPVVYINFSGSAMALNWEHDTLPAMVQAFYPGEQAGKAIADLLWGEYSPSGRLPVTFYRSLDDLPDFSDYTMQGRTYKYYKGKPLYPFGYGLSYTSFAYSDLTVAESHDATKPLKVSVTVTNTGAMKGRDIAQIYLSHMGLSDAVPLRKLSGFKAVELAPGESKTLTFALSPDQLTWVSNDGVRITPSASSANIAVGSGQPGFVADSAVASTEVAFETK